MERTGTGMNPGRARGRAGGLWLLAVALAACVLTACGESRRDAVGSTEVLIETSEGKITVRLYDDTPRHRDNFIRQAEAGCYDGILFNRIVPDMAIQAGGTGGTGGPATLPAEIIYPRHFHKQGALAAAREPDSINPARESSALQWYIVTGKKYTTAELAELQALLYEGKVAARFEQLQRDHAAELRQVVGHDARQAILSRLQVEAEEALAAKPPRPFSEAQKQVYGRTGGAPHLDGEYTVFGEVVDGMPVALRIGRTPVDARERPRRPVRIIKVTVR